MEISAADLRDLVSMPNPQRDVIGRAGKPDDAPIDGEFDGVFVIGQCYFVRTVTHHTVGRLVRVTPTEFVFEDASWVADDGGFSKALSTGELGEVERVPDGFAIVSRGAFVDMFNWNHDLPAKTQ